MGRYDNNLKCAELRKLLGERKYKQAFQVLQEIDVDKVRLVTDLNAFAEIYRKAGKYDKAREMLLRVYEKSPSKRVIYKLACIAILEKNFEDAEGYYQDYLQEDPESEERYVIRYRIDKARQLGYDVRIKDLEALKEYEYIEEWGFELAKLYHKAGMAEKCVEECNDIILWFGEGVIVEKARMLRSYYLDGNRVLGSYGSNLERARERAMRQEERAKSMKMDTSELSEQIQEYTQEDHYREIKKELEDELKQTSDVQEAMKKDLGISDTGNVQEEIARIIEEQEQEEIEAEKEEEESGSWIFNIGRKGRKENVTEPKEEASSKPDTGEIFQKLQNKVESIDAEKASKRAEKGKKKRVQKQEERAEQKEEEMTGQEEWAPPEHEEGHILSLQQSLENSLGKSVAEIVESGVETDTQEDSAEGHTARIDDIEKERLSLLRKAKEAEQKEGPYRSRERYEDMIPKKKRGDSSVIPLDEIKQALSGMRSKTRTPSFEKIETEEVKTESLAKERNVEVDDYEDAPKPAEIKIHYGERYQDFVSEEEYQLAMAEQNSSDTDISSEGEDDDLPSMEEVEKCRKEMAQEEGCIVAGLNLDDIFKPFMQYDNIRKQLIDIFKKIEEKNIKTCNFVVVGGSKSGKTTMGKLLARAMIKRGAIPDKPIAKIRSDKFNELNFEKHKSELRDSCLIVEKAGEMYVPTIKNLQKAMSDYRGHIVVILEDSQGSMERLFLENYHLNSYFEFTIRL